MKAVVMAGGEGTRLRPLTSNQPKPMVPIVGKPCIEHILELLGSHGFDEVIVTLAFLPQAIRSYFGDGESLGLSIEYSVEEVPMGTAGSVRLASRRLGEPFLVISGDALCDFDLTALIAFHNERGATATIALKSVDNPLEYGIVVADEDGRIERFLEKPSWGQVFSDTINTGVYVLDAEVLRHVPDDRPYDFSKELFPLLLEMGRPLYGFVCDGYWQDIGNLEQYQQANFDVLGGRAQLRIEGMRLRDNVWVGEDVGLDDLDGVEGPAFIGNSCRISPRAAVGPYTVLGAGVTLREQARVTRSVVDAATYVGRSTVIDGALIGRSCDIRSHVHVHERAAIGDEVVLGDECLVSSGVRIYPFKEIESGAQIHESVIWEARSTSHLFGTTGVAGLVNVDLTPETAIRLAAALGTALRRGARVVASRESPNGCRMIEWAMISGLLSTGVHVSDLRVMPAPVSRHLLRTRGYDAGFHVGLSPIDPELVEIRFFEQPGIQLTHGMEKEIEKHFTRHELRRVAVEDVAEPTYPAGVTELYAQDLLRSLDADAIRARGFRVAIDYGDSAASFVLPLLAGSLGIETVATSGGAAERVLGRAALHESLGRVKRLVQAAGADLGAAFDRSAERVYLVDERGQEIPVDRALLLFLRLVGSNGRRGRIAVPVSVTGEAERIAAEGGLEVVRTPSSSAELTRAAAQEGFVFAGAIGGAYVFPDFLPAYDAVASLCHLLELLAPVERPLSELVADVPQPRVRHRQVHCPWALKGLVMRVLAERLKEYELEVVDGIKLIDGRGWAQVIPDADEPILHVYAEGRSDEDTASLGEELRSLVERIMTEEEIGSEAQISS